MRRKEASEALTVSGIDVVLKRKAVKNIYLRISNVTADITVTVPYNLSYTQIEKFICSKTDWIRKNVALIKNRHMEKPEYDIKKEHIWLWGRKYQVQFMQADADKIEITDDKLVVCSRKVLSETGRVKAIDSYYRKVLLEEISRFLDHWQSVTGLQAEGFAVRRMKSRWGSCHVLKKFIVFNYGLVYRPKICLEYVVVHELAHLYEVSHNQRFKSFVTAFLPDWRERKKLLNNFSFNTYENENLL